MTSPTTDRRRLHTSDRLFIAAILAGAMLVPHLVLSIVGDWPAQPFSLHLLVMLLLVGGGWRAELSEERAKLAAATRKSRKDKKKTEPQPKPDEEISSFDAITRQLRESQFPTKDDGAA